MMRTGLWRPATLLIAVALVGCQSLALDREPGTPPAAPPEAPAPPLTQAWRVDAEAAFGPESPVVTADGRILVGTRDGKVVVIDGRTGSREGKGDFGDSVEGGLAVSGPLVFVPLARDDAGLVGHDAVRGTRVWALGEGPHMAAPTLVAGVLVAGAHDGTARGLDPGTGAVLWSARPDTSAQFRAAPVDAGGLAVVADTEGKLRAYDPASGDLRWTADAGAPVYRTPAASGDLLLVPTTRGRLLALDAASGDTSWDVRIDPLARWATPAVADGLVFAGATDGTIRALDAETGAERWAHTFDGNIGGAPLASGGVVYIGTYDQRVTALDAETGAELWSHEVSGRVRAGIVSAGGTVVVLAEPRFIYGFRPEALATR